MFLPEVGRMFHENLPVAGQPVAAGDYHSVELPVHVFPGSEGLLLPGPLPTAAAPHAAAPPRPSNVFHTRRGGAHRQRRPAMVADGGAGGGVVVGAQVAALLRRHTSSWPLRHRRKLQPRLYYSNTELPVRSAHWRIPADPLHPTLRYTLF